jgi:hypothetical protein
MFCRFFKLLTFAPFFYFSRNYIYEDSYKNLFIYLGIYDAVLRLFGKYLS